MPTKATSAGPADSADAGPAGGLLEAYLSELKAIRATGAGVAETSYYPALSELFNAVGKTLKPKVRCVMNLQNRGAGMPDGGLFTADQLQAKTESATTGRVSHCPIRARPWKHRPRLASEWRPCWIRKCRCPA